MSLAIRQHVKWSFFSTKFQFYSFYYCSEQKKTHHVKIILLFLFSNNFIFFCLSIIFLHNKTTFKKKISLILYIIILNNKTACTNYLIFFPTKILNFNIVRNNKTHVECFEKSNFELRSPVIINCNFPSTIKSFSNMLVFFFLF